MRVKHSLIAATLLSIFLNSSQLCAQSGPQQELLIVDATAPAHPFPHFWEKMFGSGRAILSLRDNYRRDLRQVKQVTGLEYIRFHAILDDEVGVYSEDPEGKPIYNFSY